MQLATAQQLREQAKRFQEAAQKLIEVASILDGDNAVESMSPVRSSVDGRRPKNGTRLEQLREFLRTNGPIQRKDVLARSGLPIGTVAGLLQEKHGFKKDESGLWSVIE